MSDYTRIRLRRASSSGWLEANPILGLGEAGYETDSRYLKVGDGITPWTGLNYLNIPPVPIDFPIVYLSIGDGADPRLSVNLSSGQQLNIVGSGDTNVLYDYISNTLIIDTKSGSEFLTYQNITSRLGYIPQPTGNYSSIGHTHSISQISGLQNLLDTKQATGLYAVSGHSHLLSIGDGISSTINYSSSDRLNIIGSGYTSISYDDYTNTIIIGSIGNSGVTKFNNRTGAVNLSFTDISGALNYVPQPVGSYSLSGHKHSLADITDYTASISNLPYRTIFSSFTSGNPGDICWDTSYIYICVDYNRWQRSSHAPW